MDINVEIKIAIKTLVTNISVIDVQIKYFNISEQIKLLISK